MAPRQPRLPRTIFSSAGLFKVGSAVAATAAGFSAAELLAVAALLGGFVGVVLWFDGVDFYDRHYFDTGAIAVADNMMRIVFVGILSWLIYAPGAGIAACVTTPGERAVLSPAERAVLGFGIGVGIWHVAMLILGVLGLYYRAVMVALCLAGSRRIGATFRPCRRRRLRGLSDCFTALRQRRAIAAGGRRDFDRCRRRVGAAAARTFPGGSGDYYTHYFYYYLAKVLKNHALRRTTSGTITTTRKAAAWSFWACC